MENIAAAVSVRRVPSFGIGNPLSRPPWLGEHTAAVLSAQLGLAPAEIEALRGDGVIA
jgi:crotonobetainyl-CoA:carnitine CoA-transferase CaiB-like acyl-CoA transferase